MTSGSTGTPGSTAGSTAQVDVDIERTPEFGAVMAMDLDPRLMRWLAKLETWCEQSVAERERQEKDIEELHGQVNDLEQVLTQTRWTEEALAEVGERLDDTARGVYTLAETIEWFERDL
jgi:hypothetical protein